MRSILTTLSLLALGIWLGALLLFVQVAAVAFGSLPPLFLNPADGHSRRGTRRGRHASPSALHGADLRCALSHLQLPAQGARALALRGAAGRLGTHHGASDRLLAVLHHPAHGHGTGRPPAETLRRFRSRVPREPSSISSTANPSTWKDHPDSGLHRIRSCGTAASLRE